jgi:hypothetical protein
MSKGPESTEPTPAQRLLPLITGHWAAAATYCMAELGLADRIAAGEGRTSRIAEAESLHEPSLFRLLRSLAGFGVVEETAPREFALTPVGELLRSDHPNSMRASMLFQGSPTHWASWGSLIHSVRTGGSAFEHVHGKPFFEYCKDDLDAAARFNNAMSSGTGAPSQAVADAYDFSSVRKLVDVGGGHGVLLTTILARFPGLQGVLTDLPEVVSGAELEESMRARVEIISGDFFAEVPASDAYIMKNIIHDWNDERSVAILKSVHRAAEPGAVVLIVEAIVPDGNEPSFAKTLDLEMLQATNGGVQRTEKEFTQLFEPSGFKINRVIPTHSLASIIEAVAV